MGTHDRNFNNIYKKDAGGVHYLIHLTKVEVDTGISPHDAVISFLVYEKKFIYLDTKTANIVITPKGISFISYSSFVKEQEKLDTEITLKWYEQENAKKIFEDYPSVDKRSKWAIGISIALLIVELVRLIIGQ